MAFTEFYCQNGGSNVNAGSTQSNTPVYTSIHGNYVNATGVFTPTDGVNPVTAGVTVGMYAAVYVDGAAVAAFIARITAVTNAINGAITANVGAGAKPANQTATATMKVGGAWLGPNGASGFPLTLTGLSNPVDASGNQVRINLKNDQTYSITASINYGTGVFVTQGYSSTPGDGGKATIDGGTSTGAVITTFNSTGNMVYDMIFTTSITTGTADLVTSGAGGLTMVRCVFKGARGRGFVSSTNSNELIECEFYDCNKSNTAAFSAVHVIGGALIRCFVHDNAGSNTVGIGATAESRIEQCVIESNGSHGLQLSGGRSSASQVRNCDFYNNGGDGINIPSGTTNNTWIENCNFIKNTGAGINNATVAANFVMGFVYNCGYGAGTQANGSADTLGNIIQSGKITYAANITPWVDPANGDFRINLTTANFAGRGAFTETQGYTAPNTIGYPDIGAAQSLTGSGGTFGKEVSYGFSG